MVMSDAADALATLGRADALMVEVLQALRALDGSSAEFRTLKVGIAANVTVDLLGTYLRRHAYAAGVRMQVAKGNYDDLVGDAQAHAAAGVDLLVILPFFDNLQPGWEAQIDTLDADTRTAAQIDYLNRLEVALQAASAVPQVLLFAGHLMNPAVSAHSAQLQALDVFNDGLTDVAVRHPQVRVIETVGLLARFGARHAFDARFYFRGKAPYTAGFVDQLALAAAAATHRFGTQFHKVLVLDCDNSLWGGIVGEDGLDGIKLDRYSFPGNIFWTVQHQFKALEAQGVLLCLNSKNNPADVEEVLAHHPDMVLRDAQLVAKKVNWTDKPSNLRALAAELNLGLDSFVFIDDSAFEIEAVRDQLPQVRVFQVPKALQDYPALVRDEIVPLFTAGGISAESRGKTQQYRALSRAAETRAGFTNQEDYLRSLGLAVSLQRNAEAHIPRIAELMAKSNQFNLTTERLQAGDLATLMERPDATVYSFSVSDRIAEHGLTGVLIMEDDPEDASAVRVHSFLMSCRVIGRGIEFALWRTVVANALARGKQRLKAVYRPTAKNAQVADFYDRLGLRLSTKTADGSRFYTAELTTVQLAESAWVELRDG
jgi:FkbH-like protein